MSRLANVVSIHAVVTTLSRPANLFDRFHRHMARIDAAFAGQSRMSAIQPETLRDTGLSAEALTGASAHDPDLPFFLQSRYGRDDR